ncbi:MAG: response regulator [Gammaproteobacteria bacterium]|nr:response regulator [Gammaproteobacteria bacterium]
MNRDMLTRRLMRDGYLVEVAENGRQALEKVALGNFDLVLLDIMMPEVDGYQVLAQLKASETLRHIPVIMITALEEMESVVRCIEMGAEDYVLKPFNPTLLKARVGACLEKKRLHDQEENYRAKIEQQNSLLENRVREQVREISEAQLGAIFAMSKLAESRDPETGEHLERMREYCRILSSHLATTPRYQGVIDTKFIDNIYAASPLHDIGKVGIPDAVLLKPGKLTEVEWVIMRTHTFVGAQTLLQVNREYPGNDLIRTGMAIAGGHHEKWDGSGYPYGLKGEDIPLVARVLALGDVYDALTSKRCYKDAFTHEASREIIITQSGMHFDPAVTAAFLAKEDEFKKVREFYTDPLEEM